MHFLVSYDLIASLVIFRSLTVILGGVNGDGRSEAVIKEDFFYEE